MTTTRTKLAGFGSLLCAALLIGACAMNSAPARAADACGERGTATEGSLKHGGRDRTYRLFVPSGGGSKLPLVVAMHGGWGTGEKMAEQTGLDRAASKHGFAVVYPDGVWRSWNAGSCCGKAASGNVDDVGFIRSLVKELGGSSCIDDSRVYGTGFSNGAMLTNRIACEAPGLFDAIAPVSGGPMMDNCPEKPGVPALLMVGRQDERIPWNGGVFDETYRPSIAEQVKVLAKRNRCDDAQAKVAGTSDLCERRSSCAGGTVRWCIIDGVGHQWPGGQTILKLMLGPNRDVLDASDTILRFFKEEG